MTDALGEAILGVAETLAGSHPAENTDGPATEPADGTGTEQAAEGDNEFFLDAGRDGQYRTRDDALQGVRRGAREARRLSGENKELRRGQDAMSTRVERLETALMSRQAPQEPTIDHKAAEERGFYTPSEFRLMMKDLAGQMSGVIQEAVDGRVSPLVDSLSADATMSRNPRYRDVRDGINAMLEEDPELNREFQKLNQNGSGILARKGLMMEYLERTGALEQPQVREQRAETVRAKRSAGLPGGSSRRAPDEPSARQMMASGVDPRVVRKTIIGQMFSDDVLSRIMPDVMNT